jgi:hypothetical protein
MSIILGNYFESKICAIMIWSTITLDTDLRKISHSQDEPRKDYCQCFKSGSPDGDENNHALPILKKGCFYAL